MQFGWKQILTIVLFITAVALFGFMIFWFFIRPFFIPTETAIETTETGRLGPTTVNIDGRIYVLDEQGRLPSGQTIEEYAYTPVEDLGPASQTAQGGLTKATLTTPDLTYFSTQNDSGDVIYYNQGDSRFYAIDSNGETSVYDDKAFYQVQDVTWSNNRQKAILEYPDGSKILYNFKTQEQITLPEHWEDFGFSPSDEQIGFKSMALDVENRYLAIADINGSEIRILERLGEKEDQFDVNWSPNNQIVATFNETKDYNRSNVYFIGQNNENFLLMTVEGGGFEGIWSPDGKQMVYSVYNSANDYKPELWVSDASPGNIGNNRRKLDITTWSDKCIFDSASSMYCAVPINLPYGAGLEPEANEVKVINDQIYHINLNTGVKRLIAIPEGDHNVEHLMLNEQTNQLLFLDTNDNRTYRIEL